MFGMRAAGIPGGIGQSSKYRLVYNNLEHLSDQFLVFYS